MVSQSSRTLTDKTPADENRHKAPTPLLKPVHGQGVSVEQYSFPADHTPPQTGPAGAGIDIASEAMPVEGALEVHDSDDDIRSSKRLDTAKITGASLSKKD